MFVELGTSGLSTNGLDFRYGKKHLFGHSSDFVGFFKRYAWHCADVDGERTFVEWWQEAPAEIAQHDNRCNKYGSAGSKNCLAVVEGPFE